MIEGDTLDWYAISPSERFGESQKLWEVFASLGRLWTWIRYTKPYKVKSLLIGRQVCILYGTIEFSCNIDLTIIVSPENLNNLRLALNELNAKRILFTTIAHKENLWILVKVHESGFKRCLFLSHVPNPEGFALFVAFKKFSV